MPATHASFDITTPPSHATDELNRRRRSDLHYSGESAELTAAFGSRGDGTTPRSTDGVGIGEVAAQSTLSMTVTPAPVSGELRRCAIAYRPTL